jgi:drug/metabolite transporter (DMT)-like permease
VLTYVLAVLAAAANAVSWVLQRKANREIPAKESLSWKLIRDLLHRPVWFGGIAAITLGFLLQAVALGTGALAVVEPILVIELPMTLLLGSRVFRYKIGAAEWVPIAAMTAGVAVLLFLLSPTAGRTEARTWYGWVVGIGANVALIVVLVATSRAGRLLPARWGSVGLTGQQRAALLGVAAGSAFGLTAALIKGVTGTFADGIAALFTSWQLYAMLAAGITGFFLTQSALNAGRLVAAQPGISLMDPLISVLWGVLIFGEQVRGGLLILPQLICAAVIAVAAVLLARSPMLEAQ